MPKTSNITDKQIKNDINYKETEVPVSLFFIYFSL